MSPVRRYSAAGIVAVAFLVFAGAARAEDPADVEGLISLVQTKPEGMDRAVWKEKRREAARELGRLGDTRAVPVLVEVVKTEKFDIIAEIAIEALGRLGDERAVPALREVYHDTSRDKYVREAAATAMRRIGVNPNAEGGKKKSGTGTGTKPRDLATGSTGSGVLGDSARTDIPKGPAFGDDVIAASERLTFATGALALEYDTQTEITTLDGDVRATYERITEKNKIGYSWGVDAALAAGVLDEQGDDSISQALAFAALARAEARGYANDEDTWFGHVTAAAGVTATGIKTSNQVGQDIEELREGAELHFGFGLGYGRAIDVGEGLRLRRIEKVLADGRVLGRPITPDLAVRILRTWWALRGEQGAYKRLVATVAILRDAGVLLGEPDAGTTYKILAVLLDGQLDHRLSGIDVRIGLGESVRFRDGEAVDAGIVEEGRFESTFLIARYGLQAKSGTQELVGTAFASKRLLAEDTDPSPWSADVEVAWRKYFYSDAFDPIGALEFTGAAGASDSDIDDDQDNGGIGTRVLGSVGWVWIPNRASRFALAGNVRLESGEIFVGVTFEATYGLLDTGFVAGRAVPN